MITLGGSLIAGGLYNFVDALTGIADPSLAINGYTFDNWTSIHPLLDISKQMSSWDSASGGTDWMIANGHVDASTGWITSTTLPGFFWKSLVPQGADTFLMGKQYRMQWTGAGTMVLGSGGTTDSTSANEVLFTVTGNFIQVRATSGPITGLTIVDVDHTARYDAGERIDPDYAALIADVREMRFMDWGLTNTTTQTNWASRPVVAQNSYAPSGYGDDLVNSAGVPLSLMVMLSNKIKADMWFCFPHAADDTYMTNAATYVRDNLDPDLTCKYEVSNEVWNDGFWVQGNYLTSLGKTLWPAAVGSESDTSFRLSAHSYRTYQMANIIDAVYSGILSRRGIVLNVQTDFFARGVYQMDAPVWEDYHDSAGSLSDAYVTPSSVLTHMALTSYFGGGLLTSSRQTEIAADYNSDPATSDATIEGYLRATGQSTGSINDVGAAWSAYNAEAITRGLKMCLYEGGPHMVQGGSQNVDAVAACNHWLDGSYGTAFANDIYHLWQTFSEAEAPFMQFQDVGARSGYGTWSIWEHMDDTPTGYMGRLLDRNASEGNWWGDTTDHRHGAI